MDKYYARILNGKLTHLFRDMGYLAHAYKIRSNKNYASNYTYMINKEDANFVPGQDYLFRANELRDSIFYNSTCYKEITESEYLLMRVSGELLDGQ